MSAEPTSEQDSARVVLGSGRSRLRVRRPELLASWILSLFGISFVVVGMTDLTLLWIPTQFGSATWEFGTLSRTFDSLPMTGLGFGLLAFGTVYRGRIGAEWVRGIAVLFGLAALLLIALGLLYATAVPTVIQQTPPEALSAINRAVVKNIVEIVTYPLVLLWVGIVVWRGVGKTG